MRWHSLEGSQDGLMRHPRDSQAWKTFDLLHPEFAADPRNVRLGLASDGFNPFGAMATNYSIWPVVLIPYNRPPWECMKQTSFVLSMIIPGKQLPDSCRLKHSRKWCFMGHRRFLERGHRFRLQRVRFNGKIEQREPPIALSGSDILKQVEGINVNFGKAPVLNDKGKRARRQTVNEDRSRQWRKRSIFFDLPYWETNLLRHNLDLMHIEKNVCENVIYTLLNDSEKSKDNIKARKDLREMGIRKELWADENGSYRPSLFTILNTKKGGFKKDIFLRTLKNVKMPDGYASNISRCIDLKQRKLFNMKSHDFHILMLHLLPIAIRNILPDKVTAVLIELSSFFRQLCAKSLSPIDLDRLQSRHFLTMNHLEMLFPPTFFTIMVHLTCHLASEIKLGGPKQCRWMYPVESTEIEKIVNKDFIDWFPGKIVNPDISNTVSDDLKFLANGPAQHARRFTSFNINGFKFRTLEQENGLTTQNNGVFLTSSTSCLASGADRNLRQADLPYYGKLEDIIELNYYGRFRVTLFKCKWADTTKDRGFRTDAWGFSSVNFSRLIHTGDREEHDPYIEASQAQMVYYVDDEVNKGWSTVVHLKPRDLYDMGGEGDNEFPENEPFPVQDLDQHFGDVNDLLLCREDETDEILKMPKQNRVKNQFKSVKERSSLVPRQPSQAQASSSTSYRVSLHSTLPTQPTQHVISVDGVSSQHGVPSSSDGVSSQHVVSSSSSDGVSSQPVIPSSSSGAVSSRQTGRSTSNEEPHWFVDVIDERQVIKTIRLKVKDVHNLDKGLRIIVEFDEYHAAIGKSAGLIAGVLGQLATNPMYFPIGFEKWQSMPKSYLDRVFNDIIVPRSFFYD
ncbi:hypothetical protein A4A49_41017 [Nicotiana attenuata]|uniref:DUF4216 domain-containing protein n=2 Tax=Nicotiana attenuata TaxID=49451 RepID=A0A1J6KNU0_NICAT|nr:hypothetical protein A4A49_41017 [Nicotiana attenuata]